GDVHHGEIVAGVEGDHRAAPALRPVPVDEGMTDASDDVGVGDDVPAGRDPARAFDAEPARVPCDAEDAAGGGTNLWVAQQPRVTWRDVRFGASERLERIDPREDVHQAGRRKVPDQLSRDVRSLDGPAETVVTGRVEQDRSEEPDEDE